MKKSLKKYPDGGKIGMMKARMALEAEFGNPAAKRMVSANPKRGMTPEGEGTHYMATFDNYAVPLLQDTGLDYLTYNPNPKPSKEDMRFESAEDAEYFAKHYKEIAPMMRTFKKGGKVYNPKLANSDLNFQSWYNKNTLEGQNNIPYSDKLSYDYYSYYRDALSTGGNPTNHFTDAYKRENHPTFSDESYYSGNGSKGYWKGEKFIKYPDGGKVKDKKPKYSTRMNTQRLPSDNMGNYVAPHKSVKPEDMPKNILTDPNSPLAKIAVQTYLDQKKVGRNTNKVTELISKYNNPLYGWTNFGLEYAKPYTPIVGDAVINTIQQVIEHADHPEYANGGTIPPIRKPIVVNNPNDPRLRAYNDSNELYNWSNQNRVNNLLKQGFRYDGKNNYIMSDKEKKLYQKDYNVNTKKGLQKIIQSGNDGIKDNKIGGDKDNKAQYELMHGNIAPVAVAPLVDDYWRNNKTRYKTDKRGELLKNSKGDLIEEINPNYGKPNAKDKNGEVIRNFFNVPIYKKPVQPVVYQQSTSIPSTANAIQLTSIAPEEVIPQPVVPTYTGQKQTYQGREFMETTGLRPGLYYPQQVEQAKQEQMKKGKRAFKNGGIVRYDMGGPVKDVTSSSLNLIVPGLGTALSAADSLATNPDGSPKDNKIAQFASRTNPLTNIGRIADGKDVGRSLLGLTGVGGMMEVTGLNDKLFGESDYDKEARKALEAKKSLDFTKVRMGQANTSIDTLGTTQNNMYPHGGVVTTDQPGALAELELQEQMQLPNGVVMGVDGPSHEQGGIEVNVPEGTRVFSDRLKHNGKTFAKHAKSINNKIAKLDNKPVSTATQNTEMLLNKQLDGLFNAQEEMKIVKEQNKQRKMFSKGGVIPAHNVTLMKKGGLTHYSGLDGDPSVIQNGFFANLRENALYKNAFDANKNYSFDLKSPAANNNYLGKTSNSATTGNSNLPASFWGNSFAKGAQSVYGDVGNAGLSGSMTESGAVDGASKFSMSPQNSALATQLLSNLVQNQQISGIKKPRTINPVSFTAGARPDLVDYSNERAAIDSEVAGARAGVRLGSGSYSTQAANLQKIRNQQLMNKGRSFQTERNANVQLNNAYKGQQANAYNQGVQANLGIDQYNLENEFNYNLWKTGQKLKSTGSTADTMTNVFNNQTGYQNQKDYWEVMKQMYDPKVAEDIKLPKRKLGGKIKRK